MYKIGTRLSRSTMLGWQQSDIFIGTRVCDELVACEGCGCASSASSAVGGAAELVVALDELTTGAAASAAASFWTAAAAAADADAASVAATLIEDVPSAALHAT